MGTRSVTSGHCAGDLEKVEKCNMDACPVKVCIDCIKVCKWGEWEHWDSCTKCGGQRKRTRQMHSHEEQGHHLTQDRRLKDIPTEVLCDPGASEETGPCPRKCGDSFVCEWSPWQSQGGCSTTCGPGTQKKVRTLIATKSDAVLGNFQSEALLQGVGGKGAPETAVFLSFVCGMFCFALF